MHYQHKVLTHKQFPTKTMRHNPSKRASQSSTTSANLGNRSIDTSRLGPINSIVSTIPPLSGSANSLVSISCPRATADLLLSLRSALLFFTLPDRRGGGSLRIILPRFLVELACCCLCLPLLPIRDRRLVRIPLRHPCVDEIVALRIDTSPFDLVSPLCLRHDALDLVVTAKVEVVVVWVSGWLV